jgi:hypothetical protein
LALPGRAALWNLSHGRGGVRIIPRGFTRKSFNNLNLRLA